MVKRIALFTLILVVMGLMAGCCCLSDESKAEVHTQQVILGAFCNKIDAGETTREHEQKMLKATWEAYLVLDWAVNKDKEAKALLDKMEKEED
jgi:hypothetical protein